MSCSSLIQDTPGCHHLGIQFVTDNYFCLIPLLIIRVWIPEETGVLDKHVLPVWPWLEPIYLPAMSKLSTPVFGLLKVCIYIFPYVDTYALFMLTEMLFLPPPPLQNVCRIRNMCVCGCFVIVDVYELALTPHLVPIQLAICYDSVPIPMFN